MWERRRVLTVRGAFVLHEPRFLSFVIGGVIIRFIPYYYSLNNFSGGMRHSSFYGEVPEWTKGADCKSVAIGFQGSNPCLPTKRRLRDPKRSGGAERAEYGSGNPKGKGRA